MKPQENKESDVNIKSLLELPFNNIEKKNHEMLMDVLNFFNEPLQCLSNVQLGKLVLNDIEYPTNYAKVKQIKIELTTRYYNLIELYYEIKKKELEIDLKCETIQKLKISVETSDAIKQKLIQLEKEKCIIYLHLDKEKLKNLINEIRLYYKYYMEYNKGIENLTDEQKEKCEYDLWKKKALNEPILFEERYDYIKQILSKEELEKYLNKRKTTHGLFPREIIK